MRAEETGECTLGPNGYGLWIGIGVATLPSCAALVIVLFAACFDAEGFVTRNRRGYSRLCLGGVYPRDDIVSF